VASNGKLPEVITVCLGPLVTKLFTHVNVYLETNIYFIQKMKLIEDMFCFQYIFL
jgi:hypothetical protein